MQKNNFHQEYFVHEYARLLADTNKKTGKKLSISPLFIFPWMIDYSAGVFQIRCRQLSILRMKQMSKAQILFLIRY